MHSSSNISPYSPTLHFHCNPVSLPFISCHNLFHSWISTTAVLIKHSISSATSIVPCVSIAAVFASLLLVHVFYCLQLLSSSVIVPRLWHHCLRNFMSLLYTLLHLYCHFRFYHVSNTPSFTSSFITFIVLIYLIQSAQLWLFCAAFSTVLLFLCSGILNLLHSYFCSPIIYALIWSLQPILPRFIHLFPLHSNPIRTFPSALSNQLWFLRLSSTQLFFLWSLSSFLDPVYTAYEIISAWLW